MYAVVADGPQGWRVRARRGRRGRGGFPTRQAALAHAERLASCHVVAQIQVFGSDGSLLADTARFDPGRCERAREFLEARLAPFRDVEHAVRVLAEHGGWYAENRDVDMDGETLRLSVSIHEGSMWDEIHVQGSMWDEWLGPRVAEVAFTLWQ